MSSLFAALGSSASALDVLERAMSVVQNNVANAQTPGYATQTLQLNASLFDPAHGLVGGVSAGNVQSARSLFAENNVWSANQQAGSASTQSTALQNLQGSFNVSGTSGVPGALSQLFSAFSAWSANPSSATAQQQVINGAQNFAQAVNSTAAAAQSVLGNAQQQTSSVVSQINQLTSQIANLNGQVSSGGQDDAGLQAQLYSNLESLSNLANITVQPQSNGSVKVLLGGQVSLVDGTTQSPLSVKSTPLQVILNSQGTDVTAKVQSGQLGGLLQITNSVIPSLLGDSTQQGTLNQLAQGVADRVNSLLTSGQTSSGAAGVPLFSYTSSGTAAQTLSLASGVTGSQLAAVDPGPPAVANGIADHLSQLQNPSSAADMINGQSYTDFYSSIASNVGNLAAGAAQSQTAQAQALAQAQNARGQLSGVSLNDQAATLIQYQNAYQASAQAFSTIRSTISYLLQTLQSL